MITRTYDERRQVEFVQCDAADLPIYLQRSTMSPANVEAGNTYVGDQITRMPAAWYGGALDLPTIERLFSDGWAEGAEKVQRLAETISAPVQELTVVRRRTVQTDQGDTLDGWRAMAGDWDTAWDAQTQQERQGSRVVTIATTWGGNCNRTADQLFYSGAQVIVAADLLEKAGYTVEIVAAMPTRCAATQGMTKGAKVKTVPALLLAEIMVKRADEPLRIDQIAAVFCHAGTFRTAGFGLINAAPFKVGGALGTHVGADEAYKELAPYIPAAVRPRFLMPDAFDRMTAERNIAALVADLEAAAGGDA